MSEEGDVVVVAETPVVAANAPLQLDTALPVVLKKALVYDGLSRGLREVTKALERRQGLLCVLASDCSEEAYQSLVRALCAEHGVPLLEVPEAAQLGSWAGLRKLDESGNARKVVSCSCAVIRKYGETSEALTWLLDEVKRRG